MKPQRLPENVAGKPLVLCPDCGATVREDLLNDHATRCRPGQIARAADQENTSIASKPQWVAPRWLDPTKHKAPPQKPSRPRYEPRRPGTIVCSICRLAIPDVHYTDHQRRCGSRQLAPEQPQVEAQELPAQQPRTTSEGYLIDKCWQCGHRICLIADEQQISHAYEITPRGMAGEVHICDGEKGVHRHSQLVYVDPKLANLAPRKQKKGPRKL